MATPTETRMLAHIVSGCAPCLAAVDTFPYGIAGLQKRAAVNADAAVIMYAHIIATLVGTGCPTLTAIKTEAAS